MRLLIAACVLAMLLSPLTSCPAGADTLSIGGRQLECSRPLAPSPDHDFLAPLLQGLDALGATVVADGRSATITTHAGTRITFTAGQRVVTVGGKAQRLALAPAMVDGELWLPWRETCSLLGSLGRWEASSRTLVLAPKVLKVSVAREPTAVAVSLQASLPISSYNAGTLSEPNRVVLDVLDAVLAGPAQELTTAYPQVPAIRLSQNRLNPDIVRLVLEVAESDGYSVQAEDQGCRLVVRLPAPPPEVPPPGWAALQRAVVSGERGLLQVLLTGSDVLKVASGRFDAAESATFRVENALPPTEPLVASGAHPLLKRLQCEPDQAGGVMVRVEFTTALPFVVFSDRAGVHLTAGRLPLEELVVVLDPGHGGNQPGAICCVPGPLVYEKDFNLDIAQRLARLLRAAGADVRLTREGDHTLVPVSATSPLRLDLDARTGMANACQADLFVSIHCNAGSHGQRGFRAYYAQGSSPDLADFFQKKVTAALGSGRQWPTQDTRGLRIFQSVRVPAVLLEVGYLDHPEDARLLLTAEYRQRLAEAIFGACEAYVNEGWLLAARARRSGQVVETSLPSRGRKPAGLRR